jgi:hypothetical protein
LTTGQPKVTSVNYLFSTKEAAEANIGIVEAQGFNVWYLDATGARVRLRPN